jgi:hypothetical protein
MDLRHHSQVMSGGLQIGGCHDFRLRRDPRGQWERFAFGRAWPAAVQRCLGSIRHRHQVVDAEPLAASVAMELIAARAEHRAACGTGVDFQENVPAIFVILDWKTFEKRVAGRARGGVELLSHKCSMP